MAKNKVLGRVVPRGVIVDGGRVYTRLSTNGRLIKKSFGSLKDPGALNAAVREANRHHDDKRLGRQGLERPAELMSVEEAARLYMIHHGSKKPSAVNYERVMRKFSAMYSGRTVDSFSYLDVEAYRRARGKDGISPSSQNREHTIITHFFNCLRKWKRLKVIPNVRLPEGNPGSEVPRVSEKQFRRKRVLSPQEFDQFLKSATIQVRRVCLAAVHTGLRRKDLMALTLDNVNTITSTLEGEQSKTERPYAIPISPTMFEIIETAPDHFILDFTNWHKEFARAKQRAGIDFQFRDLRRTAARAMLVQGTDIATVSSFLGHATLAMTENYVQAEPEHKRAAVEGLAGLYRAPVTDPEPEVGFSDLAEKVSELVSEPVQK